MSERPGVQEILARLNNRNRVADIQTRKDLRDAAAVIENLWNRLLRADPVCEYMHHDKSEFHKGPECPVEKWVREGFPGEDDHHE